ncbi:MAG TPA: hypothetical protein VK186_12310 [Candidatus Deferrimicrobium sp.]|nr:hypothetical protein [Candidatus Deferrimicrobium sp.]
MKDLKMVLLFFSFSMASFLVYLSLNLFYFFAIIAATILVFVMGYTSHIQWLFTVYIAAAVPLIFWGLRVLFLRRRLALNVDFTRFLVRLDEGSIMTGTKSVKEELPQDLKKLLKEIKGKIKKGGVKYISVKLAIALTAAHIVGQEPSLEEKQLRRWKRHSVRISLLEALALLILFIPFGLISLLFTQGMGGMITLLIYVMGFFFAWFLHSGIVTPIAGLIMQEKIKD